MERLIKEVQTLVELEYEYASEKFGNVNHSDHESYSIILEELEEANAEFEFCSTSIKKFWALTKDKSASDESKLHILKVAQEDAILAACELIQVAAMAYKARLTIEERSEE